MDPEDRQSSCLPLVLGLLFVGLTIGVVIATAIAVFLLWRLQ